MPIEENTNYDMTVSGNDAVNSELQYDVLYNAVYDAVLAAEEYQTVTDGQTLNSTALEYFKGVLNKQIIPKDYVIYVGEPYYYTLGNQQRTAYEYCLVYGDLNVDDTHFTGDGTIITMRTQSGYQQVRYAYNQSISLDAPLYYSRSNLGEYSGAVDYDWNGILILIGLALGGLVWLFKKLMRLKY